MLAHGEAEEGSAETTGVTRLRNEKRMVCMRRDMVTPAHNLPTDDGSDCVGAAWRSRLQPPEHIDDVHKRLGQWPLVQKIRREAMADKTAKETREELNEKLLELNTIIREARFSLLYEDDKKLKPIPSGVIQKYGQELDVLYERHKQIVDSKK